MRDIEKIAKRSYEVAMGLQPRPCCHNECIFKHTHFKSGPHKGEMTKSYKLLQAVAKNPGEGGNKLREIVGWPVENCWGTHYFSSLDHSGLTIRIKHKWYITDVGAELLKAKGILDGVEIFYSYAEKKLVTNTEFEIF